MKADYNVLYDNDIQRLSLTVEQYLNGGFSLVGGIMVIQGTFGWKYYQAVCKIIK